MDNLGEVNGISPNGKYAAITDTENNLAYLWNSENGEFTLIVEKETDKAIPSGKRLAGAWAMGVSDDGMVVGCLIMADGIQYPATYKDGEWSYLPMHAAAVNDNTAIAVTGDGKIIGGYQFINDPTSAIKGRYYPCRWILQENGEYAMEAYTDINLPNHQGFYVTTMTPDGSTLAGVIFGGAASTIAGYIKDGQLKMSNEVVEKAEPWEYKGKYYCGKDENGKQIWSEDPNDPRIELFISYYIDGALDTGADDTAFTGGFQGCDSEGNLYGMRTVATNVTDDGEATLNRYACIYNIEKDEYTDNSNYTAFAGGLDNAKYVFCEGDRLLIDGQSKTFTGEFGFSAPKTISAFYKASLDGSTLGGNLYEVNPATGEPQFFPLLVVLDKPLIEGVIGIESIENNGEAIVMVEDGIISVEGKAPVAVYDMQGRLVSKASKTSVAPGIYVVRTGNKASKVIVK